MPTTLLAWLGKTDLRAPEESDKIGLGPIAQALELGSFDHLVLLANYQPKEIAPYLKWLRARTDTPVEPLYFQLSGPTELGEIHPAAVSAAEHALAKGPRGVTLAFHLSPGTPAMAAIWMILGSTRFPAELIETSIQQGLRSVKLPFDLSADFLPDLLREPDARLRAASAAGAPENADFASIVHRSAVMTRLIERARRVAVRSVPVLIEGESGTGKELFARAIHRASPRRDQPFVPVNCGAIPPELVESELFGHEKGAFTNAIAQRKGYFEAAHGGTLFLDEIGDLPLRMQVKLLRVLQEGEVTRIGGTKPIKVDVRVIAATHRTLTDEIAGGRFREDLFYRLAVAVLRIPPLRERQGDLSLLIDSLLAHVNAEAAKEPGYVDKKLTAGAKNLLLQHPWPGNVRELLNTLHRAAIWSDGASVTIEDAREALLPVSASGRHDLLAKPLGDGFSLPDLLGDVVRSYLARAMSEANGVKKEAAELLGMSNYQTLSNWLKKYGVDG